MLNQINVLVSILQYASLVSRQLVSVTTTRSHEFHRVQRGLDRRSDRQRPAGLHQLVNLTDDGGRVAFRILLPAVRFESRAGFRGCFILGIGVTTFGATTSAIRVTRTRHPKRIELRLELLMNGSTNQCIKPFLYLSVCLSIYLSISLSLSSEPKHYILGTSVRRRKSKVAPAAKSLQVSPIFESKFSDRA